MDTSKNAARAVVPLIDVGLLIRALAAEETGLRMLGEDAAALTRCTRVLALAETAAVQERLEEYEVAWSVAQAYIDWVDAALSVDGIPTRELFGVLDVADRWLVATGRSGWRSGVLN